MEVYGEYGLSDYFWNNRDLVLQLDHSSAYNLGFRKLTTINSVRKEYLQAQLEITQLAQNANTILRGSGGWGMDRVVRDGYTHRGQFLGSGIGPGSNLQTVNISYLRDMKMLGLQIERFVHNEDFFFAVIKDTRVHWVDMSAALLGNWDYKNFLFMLVHLIHTQHSNQPLSNTNFKTITKQVLCIMKNACKLIKKPTITNV